MQGFLPGTWFDTAGDVYFFNATATNASESREYVLTNEG